MVLYGISHILCKLNCFLNSEHKQDQKPQSRVSSESVPKRQNLERSLRREDRWGQVIIPCAFDFWLVSERQKIRYDFITSFSKSNAKFCTAVPPS